MSSDRGVDQNWQFASCTNEIYKPLLGGTAKEVRESRGLSKSASLRDNLDPIELTATRLAEQLAAKKMKQDNLQGFKLCRNACTDAGSRVKRVFD